MSSIPAWLDPVAAARSDEASCDELDFLSRNPSFEVRAAVAENPRTHPLTLLRLAEDPDEYVLSRLVRRPLPTRASGTLGRHERPYVRRWVAELQYCPPGLLDELARDPAPCVRAAVARKDGVSDTVLAALVYDPCMPVRAAVAMRTEVPFLLVLRLAADENRTVRAYALRHFCPDPLPVRWTFPDLELVAP